VKSYPKEIKSLIKSRNLNSIFQRANSLRAKDKFKTSRRLFIVSFENFVSEWFWRELEKVLKIVCK